MNGKFHRTDGPAIEYINGTKIWYTNDKLHRTDGPAIEYANGDKEWYADDKKITTRNYQSFVNDYPDLVNQFLAYGVLNK